jgi:membrane protein
MPLLRNGTRQMKTMYRILKKLFWQLYEAFENWQRDDAAELAAATSYYMALSFFPLLLLLLSVAGFVFRFTGWGQGTQQWLLTMLADQAAPSLANQVQVALSSLESRAILTGPVGLITLLLASIGVFVYIDNAFDRIWNLPPEKSSNFFDFIRRFLTHRLRAFLYMLGLGLLITACFLVNMSLSTIQTLTEDTLPLPSRVWSLLTVAIAVATNWLLFTLLYKIIPKAPVRWLDAAGGGLWASIVWEIGRRILAAIVIGSNYSIYGVVGAFIAIMLWVYYAAATVFFGAEYVQILCKKRLKTKAS